jgi:hypothetical protein
MGTYGIRVGSLGGIIIRDPLEILIVGLCLGIPFGILAHLLGL